MNVSGFGGTGCSLLGLGLTRPWPYSATTWTLHPTISKTSQPQRCSSHLDALQRPQGRISKPSIANVAILFCLLRGISTCPIYPGTCNFKYFRSWEENSGIGARSRLALPKTKARPFQNRVEVL